MTDYTRFKYTGSTPGGDSNDYVLFSTTTAFGGKCAHQQAGLHKLVLDLFHTQAGTLKLYRSADRGTTWTQVTSEAKAIPAAGLSSQYEVLVECFEDFKLVWTNGGVAQATWYADVVLTDERYATVGGSSNITIYGVSGFDDTNIIASPAGGGYRGNASGFTVAVLVRINTQVASAQLYSYNDGGVGAGYYFVQDTATTIRFVSGHLTGDFSESAQYSPAGDIGEVNLLLARHTGLGGAISLWSADAKVGADVATSGYVLPSAGLRCTVGCRNNNTSPHTGADVFAWAGWDIALSDAQIHDVYDYVRLNGTIPSNITGTQADTALCINVGNDVTDANVPSTFTDTAGSEQNFTVAFGSAAGLDLVTAVVTP